MQQYFEVKRGLPANTPPALPARRLLRDVLRRRRSRRTPAGHHADPAAGQPDVRHPAPSAGDYVGQARSPPARRSPLCDQAETRRARSHSVARQLTRISSPGTTLGRQPSSTPRATTTSAPSTLNDGCRPPRRLARPFHRRVPPRHRRPPSRTSSRSSPPSIPPNSSSSTAQLAQLGRPRPHDQHRRPRPPRLLRLVPHDRARPATISRSSGGAQAPSWTPSAS